MSLLVPVALNSIGETVTPTCSKDDGPFMCIDCKESVILKQGETNRWHFAHSNTGNAGNTLCSAGGESYAHMAAKMLLVKYISRFRFTSKCRSGDHIYRHQYAKCTASPEYRYDGIHSADVGVFYEKYLKSIVEVKMSHATTGESLKTRIDRVGAKNVWEVSAMDVLKYQNKLVLSKDTVTLDSIIPYQDSRCKKECIFLDSKCSSKRPCYVCNKWGQGFFRIVTPKRYIDTDRYYGPVNHAYLCFDCCMECIDCGEPSQKRYGGRCYPCNIEGKGWRRTYRKSPEPEIPSDEWLQVFS